MSVLKSKCDGCNISDIVCTLKNGRCPIDGALCKKIKGDDVNV